MTSAAAYAYIYCTPLSRFKDVCLEYFGASWILEHFLASLPISDACTVLDMVLALYLRTCYGCFGAGDIERTRRLLGKTLWGYGAAKAVLVF